MCSEAGFTEWTEILNGEWKSWDLVRSSKLNKLSLWNIFLEHTASEIRMFHYLPVFQRSDWLATLTLGILRIMDCRRFRQREKLFSFEHRTKYHDILGGRMRIVHHHRQLMTTNSPGFQAKGAQ